MNETFVQMNTELLNSIVLQFEMPKQCTFVIIQNEHNPAIYPTCIITSIGRVIQPVVLFSTRMYG